MKYLIIGGTGQLGTELTKLMEDLNQDSVSFGSNELNIEDEKRVREVLRKEKPDVVFHCAAYTAVDAAEAEQEKNWSVNVDGTRNVASVCKELDCIMVYVSTDYVFDGRSDVEYDEKDAVNPLNEYGKAKLAGERVIEGLLEKYYIIRTSWVFGEYGANFVYAMKKLAKTHKKLTVINDQIGRPTWTKTLADFMVHLVETEQNYGTYHLSNNGTCSWYEFAKEILKNEDVQVEPILTKDYNQKAIRPKRSIMSLKKAESTGFNIPHWKEALENFSNRLTDL